MSEPAPQLNVRLEAEDGTQIPCRLVRNLPGDHDGMKHWLAVPDTEPDARLTYMVLHDGLPPKTGFAVDWQRESLLETMERLNDSQ